MASAGERMDLGAKGRCGIKEDGLQGWGGGPEAEVNSKPRNIYAFDNAAYLRSSDTRSPSDHDDATPEMKLCERKEAFRMTPRRGERRSTESRGAETRVHTFAI